jgi:hypothetical protein
MKSTYRKFLSDMNLKPDLMRVSTKFEPQVDKVVLEKHRYRIRDQDPYLGPIVQEFYIC